MTNDIYNQLHTIVEETKRQNERKNLDNILTNIYNFGFDNGKKSTAKTVITSTLLSLFNSYDVKPKENNQYLGVFFDTDNTNNFTYDICDYVDGQWGWESDIESPLKNMTFFWIDVFMLAQIKGETLKDKK